MHKSSRAGPLPSDWQIWCNHLHTIIGRVRFLPLSWGELSFSCELDRNHPYHHRDQFIWKKRNGERPKKTPRQTRSHSSLYQANPWLLPHGHEHRGSRGVTPPQGRSPARCRVPWVLAPWSVSLGRYPPAHPSPGITALWGSLLLRAQQEQKLQGCSHSQDLFVCTHTALSLHHKLLQSASQKNRWLFNQIKDQSCI